MRKTIFTFLLVCITNATYCQENPEDYIKKFFATYQTNTDEAIDDIYSSNSWAVDMKDAITGLKKAVRSYPEEMGKYYGFDFITKQKCTDRFILLTYMIRYDRQPFKITFEFYKPNNKWVLYSLNFVSDIDEDLEMAAKFHIQNPEKQ